MPRRLIAIPLLSSVLYILAFPNFNYSWLAWFALVPLSLMAHRTSPLRAFLWGWLSGTLSYAGILYWIIVTFQAAHLSILLASMCLLLLSAYLGLYWGAWTWLIHKNQSALWGAAAWVALEYLRTYLFSGFPWALLADSQVRNLPLIQIACVTGVYGVSFVIVLMNLALASLRPRTILTTFGLILAIFFGGRYTLRQIFAPSPSRPLKVALLQGSIDQYKKWDKAYVDDIEKTYENLLTEATQSKPDLIIWPETSVPGYLLQDKPLRDWLTKNVIRSQTTNLVGAPIEEGEKAYNSAFSLDPEGRIEGEYDKQHLVPFGEIVPWSAFLGRYIRVLNDLGGFTAGNKSAVIKADGVRLGVNICYEAIFPNLVRQSVRQGAEVIANLTNDGWYMKTAAPYQHWAPNIFRAVENHRWVVRADNTGISGMIDPSGRVTMASTIFQPLVIHGTVELRSDMTFYTRFGDVFAWACSSFCAASILLYILQLL